MDDTIPPAEYARELRKGGYGLEYFLNDLMQGRCSVSADWLAEVVRAIVTWERGR